MTTKQKPGNWNYGFSRLRVLACLAIIVLHTFNYSLIGAEKYGYAVSAAGSFWGQFLQFANLWAVPVFLMITGALLLDPSREITTGKIWKRYIARVGFALVLFGLVFLIIDMAMGDLPITPAGFGRGLVQLVTGHSWSHMWYLYLLIGLYLLLPFFRKITAASNAKELRYLLVVLLVFLSLVPILGIFGIQTDYRFSVATIYPLYFFLGYAVDRRIIKIPKWAAWVTLGVSLAVLAIVTLYGSPEVVSYFASYNSIVVVALAWSIFELFRGIQRQPSRALLSFDECSFGIYLFQMIPIKLLIRVAALNPFGHPWEFPGMILGIALVSWGIIWLFRLIPVPKSIKI